MIVPALGLSPRAVFESRRCGCCLNLKKVDTFGNNTKSKNETKDTDTTSVQ